MRERGRGGERKRGREEERERGREDELLYKTKSDRDRLTD